VCKCASALVCVPGLHRNYFATLPRYVEPGSQINAIMKARFAVQEDSELLEPGSSHECPVCRTACHIKDSIGAKSKVPCPLHPAKPAIHYPNLILLRFSIRLRFRFGLLMYNRTYVCHLGAVSFVVCMITITPVAAPRVGQLFRNSNVYQMSIVVKVGCSETRSSSDNISRRRCSSGGMGWPDVTRCCACRPVCSCAHVGGMSIVLAVRLLGIVLALSFVKSEIKSVR
jgi:hypothetical protein